MPKFLIIRFSSIGDIIQCMGIIDGIREHFPDAEIHWIARKDMSSFLAMDKRIGKIWAFDKALGLKGLLKIARQLREEHYDYIYDAHSNIRSNILRLKLLPWWSKGPHFTLRSKERWKRFLLFNWGINRFPWPFRGCRFLPETTFKMGDRPFPGYLRRLVFPGKFPGKAEFPYTGPYDYPCPFCQLDKEKMAGRTLEKADHLTIGIPLSDPGGSGRYLLRRNQDRSS